MTRTTSAFAAIILTAYCGGCGCGDRLSYRRLELTETGRGVTYPIEVDTSQLPPNAVESRTERTDHCGAPTTVIRINPNQPIKVIIVPSTWPS